MKLRKESAHKQGFFVSVYELSEDNQQGGRG